MRTTIDFEDDVAQLIAEYRRTHEVGLSSAVNQLIRERAVPAGRAPFVQRTSAGYARVDVGNVGDVLAMLDEDDQ